MRTAWLRSSAVPYDVVVIGAGGSVGLRAVIEARQRGLNGRRGGTKSLFGKAHTA